MRYNKEDVYTADNLSLYLPYEGREVISGRTYQKCKYSSEEITLKIMKKRTVASNNKQYDN